MRAIHGEMRQAEETLARELAASREDRLVVVDGPLTFEESTRGSAVGYIKRVIKPYLSARDYRCCPSWSLGKDPDFRNTRLKSFRTDLMVLTTISAQEEGTQIFLASSGSKWPRRWEWKRRSCWPGAAAAYFRN